MTNDDEILPLTLYGPEVSYFTGKLEAVIRYMELPYRRVQKAPVGELAQATGVAQVPGLQLADGRWLTDSTPIIAMRPPKRVATSDCANVCAPPTSTTRSTPRPPVRARIR